MLSILHPSLWVELCCSAQTSQAMAMRLSVSPKAFLSIMVSSGLRKGNDCSNINKPQLRKSCTEEFWQKEEKDNVYPQLTQSISLSHHVMPELITHEVSSQAIRRQWHLMRKLVIPLNTKTLNHSACPFLESGCTLKLQVLVSFQVAGGDKPIKHNFWGLAYYQSQQKFLKNSKHVSAI